MCLILWNTNEDYNYIEDRTYECSCFIQFIKQIGEKKIKCEACKAFIAFCKNLMFDSFYCMTLKITF